jgi:hypothetical protein
MSKYQQINQHLHKIITSQCFSKSVVLKELLKFLVEKSIRGEVPKEVEITYEVFGKSKGAEKEKNIRIYVYNLRKKLKEYYNKEGQNDLVLFSIPKGGYQVEIKSNQKLIIRSKIAKFSPYILGAAILLFILSISMFHQDKRSKIAKSFIWNDIYESEYPLLIVLGDHYFVNQKNVFGSMSSTRFTNINSNDDFDRMLQNYPEIEKDVLKTEQTYINKQGPFGMYKLMTFMAGGGLDINMRYSSELHWEHMKNTNTIYIGSYKSQHILKQIFEEIGIQFDFSGSMVHYTTSDSTFTFNPYSEEFLNKEFASLVHFETEDGRIVLALMCNTDVGNIATIKHLSSPENLKTLKSRVKEFNSNNFKAIFEVRGQQTIDFKINLKRIDPITTDVDKLWP